MFTNCRQDGQKDEEGRDGMTDIDQTVGANYRRVARPLFLLAILSVVALTGFLSPLPIYAAGDQSPTETIQGTVTDLFSILNEDADSRRSEARRREIERVIRGHAQYEHMAKRSLGVSWGELDDVAQRAYLGLFVELLRDSLANRMTQYQSTGMRYLSERQASEFAEVKTRLEGHKVDTAVDFRLMRQEGRWLVYDVIIDGASLMGSYRAQFASLLRDVSCTQLMERIKAHTLLVKGFESTQLAH
jgi:phospholipid transport system substrate-binding protein